MKFQYLLLLSISIACAKNASGPVDIKKAPPGSKPQAQQDSLKAIELAQPSIDAIAFAKDSLNFAVKEMLPEATTNKSINGLTEKQADPQASPEIATSTQAEAPVETTASKACITEGKPVGTESPTAKVRVFDCKNKDSLKVKGRLLYEVDTKGNVVGKGTLTLTNDDKSINLKLRQTIEAFGVKKSSLSWKQTLHYISGNQTIADLTSEDFNVFKNEMNELSTFKTEYNYYERKQLVVIEGTDEKPLAWEKNCDNPIGTLKFNIIDRDFKKDGTFVLSRKSLSEETGKASMDWPDQCPDLSIATPASPSKAPAFQIPLPAELTKRNTKTNKRTEDTTTDTDERT